ncbi:MAG: hypothetical protein R3D55_23905 [Chloroflexota bacterium]
MSTNTLLFAAGGVVAGGGGNLAALLAALRPVLKGAAITRREAIALYGLGADFGNSRLDQFVEQTATRLLPSPLPAAGQHVPPQRAVAAADAAGVGQLASCFWW